MIGWNHPSFACHFLLVEICLFLSDSCPRNSGNGTITIATLLLFLCVISLYYIMIDILSIISKMIQVIPS